MGVVLAVGICLLITAGVVALRSMLPGAYGQNAFRYQAKLAREGSEVVAKMRIAAVAWRKGHVRITAASLNGQPALALPPRLGGVGNWEGFELRFPAGAAKASNDLIVTARYHTLFGRIEDVQRISCKMPREGVGY